MEEMIVKIIHKYPYFTGKECEEIAKTIIDVLKEPTQEMIGAGIDVGGELGWGCYYSNYKNVYQAMIGAM